MTYEVGYKRPPKDKQWKPGQSGNPGGIDSATRKKINENARKAVRLQELFLDGLLVAAESLSEDERDKLLRADVNKIMADALDRSLGKATQPIDNTSSDGSMGPSTVRIVAVKPEDGAS